MAANDRKLMNNTQDSEEPAIPPLPAIYLCEHPDGPVGWTRTADEAVEWAMAVRDPRLVKITKLYEIKMASLKAHNRK